MTSLPPRVRAWGLLLPLACVATAACVLAPGYRIRTAHVVGATEMIHVAEADLDFLARIDSGAGTTSINALDVQIEDPAPGMRDNVGKRVRFRVENEEGRSRWIEATISDVTFVRSTHHTEARYIVPLHLRWEGVEKRVAVNLRDRTPMSYKLLVGRDWLGDDFLIDVDLNARE